MSGLSVRLFDDDGNLSYKSEYNVRRLIQRGVIDKEPGVSLDMEELGYNWVYDNNKSKWVIDEGKTTGRFLLIAEYDSGRDDETDISIMVPMTQTNPGGNPAEFVFDNEMLYSSTIFGDAVYYSLNESEDDEWVNGDKFCLEIIKADFAKPEFGTLKFDEIKINDGIISTKKDVSDQTETVLYLRVACAMVKTLRGKRWLCVMPLIINEDFGCQIVFRRKINGGLIRYFVVEVE